ncbi:MAG: type II secretion system protein GspD [Calditrichia bacterium]
MKREFLLILLFLFAGILPALSQERRIKELRKETAAPDEMVSFAKQTSFDNVITIFNGLSKKYLGKVIIDPTNSTVAIGVDVNREHWLTAFEGILSNLGLWYEETEDYIQIVSKNSSKTSLSTEELEAIESFESREVIISAVFFEADASKLRQIGTSWGFSRNDKLNPDIKQIAGDNQGGLLEFSIAPDLDWGNLTAIFKTLENDKVGEVIANPQVTVRSGEEGRIQVGSDVAVTLKDFSGNSVTQFFSTGSIINVKPIIVKHNGVDFINLDLKIERSNSSSGDAGLEIKKSLAETAVLLLDGEETVIGGLYVNEETASRDGVPILKDLPGWLFGLRYLFGFESTNVIKKELLILIRAELLPTLAERFRDKLEAAEPGALLEKTRDVLNERMEKIQESTDKRTIKP